MFLYFLYYAELKNLELIPLSRIVISQNEDGDLESHTKEPKNFIEKTLKNKLNFMFYFFYNYHTSQKI